MSHRIDGLPPAARAPGPVAPATGRAGGARDEPVSATAPADRVSLTGDAEGLKAMGRQLGAAPAGIDMARVNALRAAIADGTYSVDAQTVATRMLALERALGD